MIGHARFCHIAFEEIIRLDKNGIIAPYCNTA